MTTIPFAGSAALTVGANVTLNVHVLENCEFGSVAGLTGHVLLLGVIVKSPALKGAILVMVAADVLLFVRTTKLLWLGLLLLTLLNVIEVPMATDPKPMEAGRGA